MKKTFARILFLILIVINIPKIISATEELDYLITMKQDLLTLKLAYPEHVKSVEKNGDKVYLIMKSGKRSYMMIKEIKPMMTNFKIQIYRI